ncbi:MAG: cytochrome P450, partial [Longispora sp.]|nr:cytochrome P450 [Longispora sp. (in: high G+C Gram-positive bacteria)]
RMTGVASRLRQGEAVDLNADLITDLPLLVLSELVELPIDDIRRVKDFSAAALELFWGPIDPARQEQLAERVGAYHVELRGIARTGPGLAAALRAGGFGEDEVTATLFFLLVAGQETTSQFLTLLTHRLLDAPRELLDGLVGGWVDISATVEEGLRLEPPIVSWRRVTAVDTAIGGLAVPAGTSVLLWLGAANRVEAASAHDFVPGQPGSRRHLSFGAGAHRCLGTQLARMEAAVVLGELAPLLRGCTVVQAPAYPDNLSFRMPDALIVRMIMGTVDIERSKNRLADGISRLNVDKEPRLEVIQT